MNIASVNVIRGVSVNLRRYDCMDAFRILAYNQLPMVPAGLFVNLPSLDEL